AMADAAVEVGKDLPVVITSRTGSGPTLKNTYHGKGSETHLREAGLYYAASLAPLKARLRLLVGLCLDLDPGQIFQEDG
ncbi:MAG: asparaginase, partial [bacterium]